MMSLAGSFNGGNTTGFA